MNLNPISLWLLILGMPDLIHISCLLTLALSWVPCNSCQTCSHMFSSYPFSHKNNDLPPRHVKSAFLFFDALRWCFGRSTNDAGNGRPGYVGPSPPRLERWARIQKPYLPNLAHPLQDSVPNEDTTLKLVLECWTHQFLERLDHPTWQWIFTPQMLFQVIWLNKIPTRHLDANSAWWPCPCSIWSCSAAVIVRGLSHFDHLLDGP